MEKPFTLNIAGIGEDFRRARQHLDISVAQLAERAGVAASHIWNIEQGRREMSVEKFFILCAHLGLSASGVLEENIAVNQSHFRSRAEATALVWAKGNKEVAAIITDYVAGCSTLVCYALLFRSSWHIGDKSGVCYTENLRRALNTVVMRNAFGLAVKDRAQLVDDVTTDPARALTRLGLLTPELYADYLQERARRVSANLPLEWVIEFEKKPLSAIGDPMADADPLSLGLALEGIQKEQEAMLDEAYARKAYLDKVGKHTQIPYDMAKLDDWIKRLRKVCERRGAMSRVARALKVSRQAVAQWLLDDPETRTWPSGELVLPLIEWVQSEEAQQKISKGGATPMETKTRKR